MGNRAISTYIQETLTAALWRQLKLAWKWNKGNVFNIRTDAAPSRVQDPAGGAGSGGKVWSSAPALACIANQ